tara:strand:+ start:5614 stop:6708 length:1095 start_codon:yes stop_codon:yes gene_type:complete
MIKKTYILLIIIGQLLISCKKDVQIIRGCTDYRAVNYNPSANFNDGSCSIYQTTPYYIVIPEGFPNMEIPKDNQLTEEGVSLGKKLFNDPILSANNNQSCASCHLKEKAFSDPNRFSIGIQGIQGIRNASSLINVGWNDSLNWDGSSNSLEKQAFEPVTNPFEMHNTWLNVEKNINNDSTYKILFKQAFGIDYIDSTSIVKAISQFERTIISSNSKYDKWLKKEVQLTPSELNGYAIFNSEIGDCFHCHILPGLFMDNLFHNNGLDSEPFEDLGLAIVTNKMNDQGKFKTATLRNIELSAPYMHDGRFATLEEVVEHYNSGIQESSTLDPILKKNGIGLQLTNKQKEDLVSFLKTLTDPSISNN